MMFVLSTGVLVPFSSFLGRRVGYSFSQQKAGSIPASPVSAMQAAHLGGHKKAEPALFVALIVGMRCFRKHTRSTAGSSRFESGLALQSRCTGRW